MPTHTVMWRIGELALDFAYANYDRAFDNGTIEEHAVALAFAKRVWEFFVTVNELD